MYLLTPFGFLAVPDKLVGGIHKMWYLLTLSISLERKLLDYPHSSTSLFIWQLAWKAKEIQ